MMWRICYQYCQYLLALSLLAGILPVTQAADDPTETFLYEQVRLGNSKSNDVLVSQSLYRLSLIKPNDPSVLLMRIQFAVKQKKQQKHNNWLSNYVCMAKILNNINVRLSYYH
ncbi:hypothetical protein ACU42Y_17795 [Proteus mirabilis]